MDADTLQLVAVAVGSSLASVSGAIAIIRNKRVDATRAGTEWLVSATTSEAKRMAELLDSARTEIAELHVQVQRLHTLVADLQAENAALRADIARLTASSEDT